MDDFHALKQGHHIVVGTVGRMLGLIQAKDALDTSKLKYFVIDEADSTVDDPLNKVETIFESIIKYKKPQVSTVRGF